MRKLIAGVAVAGITAVAAFAFRRRLAVLLGRTRGAVARPADLNDPALARKVESELFRDARVPKGQIDVNVQERVVQLRGEVPTEDLLQELVARARTVDGVAGVESLLHLPGQDAPMHA